MSFYLFSNVADSKRTSNGLFNDSVNFLLSQILVSSMESCRFEMATFQLLNKYNLVLQISYLLELRNFFAHC